MSKYFLALPPLVLLAACGPNEIAETNAGNVPVNDAQENFASINEGEVTRADTANAIAAENGAMPAGNMANMAAE